jgi:hypothetical protein
MILLKRKADPIRFLATRMLLVLLGLVERASQNLTLLRCPIEVWLWGVVMS